MPAKPGRMVASALSTCCIIGSAWLRARLKSVCARHFWLQGLNADEAEQGIGALDEEMLQRPAIDHLWNIKVTLRHHIQIFSYIHTAFAQHDFLKAYLAI